MEKLEVKATLAVDEAGVITGTAWPFGSPDSVGDIITKGAFNVAVDDLPMLFSHDPSDLIGTWDEATETAEGFVVKGKLHLENARARAVRGLIQGGLVSGLSIGFKTKASTKQGRNRVISALDLFEISVVRNPSHPRARVNGTTLAALRKLKDGQGNYLWQPSYQSGQPEMILGRPVIEVPDMDDVGAAKSPILFGDIARAYRVIDRLDLSILVNPYLLATNGTTRVHATRRVGAGVIQPAAIRKITCAVDA